MKYKVRQGLLLLICGIVTNQNFGQGIHAYESAKDTNTLNHFFKKGHFQGHLRSYFSSTVNQKELSDYYAWGVGAGIGYETPKIFKHFQVGMSGFFMFNLASSDLSIADGKTNQFNRYEIGLFDVERPNDHEDLDRLEELFLKVHVGKKSLLTIGRQIPQTPFINPQDGRMRPTLTESVSLELKENKFLTFHTEYIWRISPRSTVKWFEVGESIGKYPVGVDLNGKPSMYKDNIQSKGVGILGILYQKKQWNIQLWDTYIDNVLNTGFAKIEWKSSMKADKNWFIGGQIIHQNTLGTGGNSDPSKAYSQPKNQANVLSARFGRQSLKFNWFVNATRITSESRYLMPREWGRETFYTFMPRERNEGMGDVNAVSINAFLKPEKHIKIELSTGYFRLPDVKNYALNKYGLPSYSQINLGITYQFDRYLKGLNAQLLVVRKDEFGETYQNDRFVFNKVNMTHLNFIINYHY